LRSSIWYLKSQEYKYKLATNCFAHFALFHDVRTTKATLATSSNEFLILSWFHSHSWSQTWYVVRYFHKLLYLYLYESKVFDIDHELITKQPEMLYLLTNVQNVGWSIHFPNILKFQVILLDFVIVLFYVVRVDGRDSWSWMIFWLCNTDTFDRFYINDAVLSVLHCNLLLNLNSYFYCLDDQTTT
jgi:hypothetical protein